MNAAPLLLTVFLPAAAIPVLAATGSLRLSGWLNLGFSGASLAASLVMAGQVLHHGPLTMHGFHVDAFNVYLLALTTFVAFTTAIFSRPYMAQVCRSKQLDLRRMRLYHASYQGFMFTMLLALATDNLGVLWVAVEGATLATVLLVSFYRTPSAVEAAWKYFILCGVGIALALFGTVLVYFAAQQAQIPAEAGLTWSALHPAAHSFNGVAMGLAFVFLLVGYGTKVGLVPMHFWLPDAHSEGPTPVSAVLSGLLLNVALYAVVRFKMLADAALAGTSHAHAPGYLMMGFGLASFLVAGLSLHRQRDIKRMFSFSSIEHMGLMTFTFGLGTPVANFAAMLHMTTHSLVKSGIFFTVGHAAQNMGTQAMTDIRGLIRHHPGIGWGLLIGTCAIAGFPPFGVFTSEFLILSAALQQYPWTVGILLPGLLVAAAGLFRFVPDMAYGTAPGQARNVPANMVPVYAHLALALMLGLSVPAFLAGWYDQAAALIHGSGV
jgi:hydrogenase-4 component F